jgi:hypothetical protein
VVDMQMSRRNGESGVARLGVRKVETKSQRDPLRRAASLSPSPPLSLAPRSVLAPSWLAQMKFSATLHSNAIKARIAS